MPATLLLRRKVEPDIPTMGELYGPDSVFWSHTCEDPVRNVKIPKATAIPAGTYEIVIDQSLRFKRPMPRLLNVPYYTGVLIHPGNSELNTEGCLLVGKWNRKPPWTLTDSRDTFDRLFPMIRKLLDKDSLFIKIEGGFPAEEWTIS